MTETQETKREPLDDARRSLYEIGQDMIDFLEAIEKHDGDLEAALGPMAEAYLKCEDEELPKKIAQYLRGMRYLKHRAGLMTAEKKIHDDMVKTYRDMETTETNKRKRMERALRDVLIMLGREGQKITTPKGHCKVVNGGGQHKLELDLEDVDIEDLPEEFVEYVPTLKKDEVRRFLEGSKAVCPECDGDLRFLRVTLCHFQHDALVLNPSGPSFSAGPDSGGRSEWP